jgi:DNA polymerase
MKNMINILQLKRLHRLKNLGYNYIDLVEFQENVRENVELPDSMDVLASTVRNCHLCELSKTRSNTVFGEGNIQSSVVFVGEAPGETEDNTGRPFVGRAGALLTKMIENVLGVKREDVYIANIVKCRPPGNAVPTPTQVSKCKPYLEKQLSLINPKLVVALGSTAFTHLTGSKISISKARGEVMQLKDFKLIATYHPSYLLRNPSMKKQSYEDLLKIKSFL